ncbi:sodium:solute symporter family protein [Brevibacillus fluminis]|uniref:Sodium:solute symporter family protein n=1 Tax=Brevibacillus fluminis TaxID=511487 RepID=A0A3M8CUU4_9BACL|nr:sodium:solute symporter family protein [Brevibacillus fluminis]RNB79576.1 sodium:solute symporter family protein [Brevibacillus fluminis]
MNAAIAIGIIAGFILLNAIIIKIFHKKQGNMEEFAVGGRSFPWFLSVFGFIGSWYVGSMYTGFFGDSATIGMFAQYLAVYSVGTMVTMYIMVRPVWIWGKLHNLQTNADLVALRYNSKWLGLFIAITTFVFWSPWLVVEIKTLGYLFNAATYNTLPFNLGMTVISLFVIVYCWLGGSRATIIGDLVQGLFFTVVGSITMIYLLNKAYGGIGAMFTQLAEQAPQLLVINEQVGYGGWSSAIITGALGGMMMPGIFIRLYMSKGVKESKKSVLFVPLIGALFTILLLWLGLGAKLVNGFPQDAQAGAFWIADHFGGPVAVGLMGIFALAASMSTISAATMTAAVMIGRNFLGLFKLPEERIFKYSRMLTLVVGVIAILVSTMEISRLVALILYVYDCIAQVAVPILLGLYWRRATTAGAFSGTLIGMVTVLFHGSLPWLTAWAGDWSAGMVGLFYNLILFVGVSLLTAKQAHVDQLFEQLENYRDEEDEAGVAAADIKLAK